MLSSLYLPKTIMRLRIPRPVRYNDFNIKALILLCILGIFWVCKSTSFLDHVRFDSSLKPITEYEIQKNSLVARQFIKVPVPEDDFGEMGRRIQVLTRWLMQIGMESNLITTKAFLEYEALVEKTITSLFPFIQKGTELPNQNPNNFVNLRKSFVPGSRGIVVPTGIKTFRYTCHLILNLRSILNSTLPIQIVYAGNSDLPPQYRSALLSLFSTHHIEAIEFLDLTKILDDTTLQLSDGMSKWAIKPFALLASTFEQVILVDSDAVFLQPPETILDTHAAYAKSGTLFFHDRLIGKNSYRYRHEFWRWQMKDHTPSRTFRKSRVMNENFGQEQDSGVVVLDKGRLGVLMGLLHACWQNTYVVRELITYRNTHGDKEAYWLGMELSGVEYSFAENYGGIFGKQVWNLTDGIRREDVCGCAIAHVDEKGELLWFNGGLVRKKSDNEGMRTFMDVDGHMRWALNGHWRWNRDGNKWDAACMDGGAIRILSVGVKGIIAGSIEEARGVDDRFAELMGLLEPKVVQKEGKHQTSVGGVGVGAGFERADDWNV
ncbi:hypothetical protein BOTCAL_0083g00340 [Botryotinia calthae]|uniref:Glycosyltransferase family 71 protein n=1 Tax=Botryotinia calthae TaxID=38488 RepID=A0A4Y8D7T0_9HELO|nr:hypothetical protein BOTCAL_0083g00340 [Botryotinia calthae]